MSRAQSELDRMSVEAWRRLGGDVKRAGRRLGLVGKAYSKKHPILVFGGGALLGFLALWRLRRPAPVVVDRPRGLRKLGRFAWTLLRVGGVGLTRAFSFKSRPDSGAPRAAGPSNGRTQG
jgi:hypothetical protein